MDDLLQKAWGLILPHEVGWKPAGDPTDPGGETLDGVTRRDWGFLAMWDYIDLAKDSKGVFRWEALGSRETMVVKSNILQAFDFGYWRRIRGDGWPNFSLAVQVADCAFNTGNHKAVAMMQESLNVLNSVGRLWGNIAVDGGCGPITLRALRDCVAASRGEDLHHIFQSERTGYYKDLMESVEDREKYLGWFRRARSWSYQG